MQRVAGINLIYKTHPKKYRNFGTLGLVLMRSELVRTETKDPKLSFQGQNLSDGKAKNSTDSRVRCS